MLVHQRVTPAIMYNNPTCQHFWHLRSVSFAWWPTWCPWNCLFFIFVSTDCTTYHLWTTIWDTVIFFECFKSGGVEVMLFRGHFNDLDFFWWVIFLRIRIQWDSSPILHHHLGEDLWFTFSFRIVASRKSKIYNKMAINHWWRWEIIIPNGWVSR